MKNIFNKILIAFCFVFIFNINTIFAEGEVVIDSTAPVITLVGANDITINTGDVYNDAGAEALDETDGIITDRIVVNNNVDILTPGNYIVTYDVSDLAGNNAIQVSRSVTVEDNVVAPSNISINVSVDVPASCEVVDMDGVSHTYNSTNSDSYLGICALQKIIDAGYVSNIKLSNQYPSMGLFVTSIAGKEADPSSQYWALYKNGNYAEVGLSSLPISSGDIISLKLSDFSGNLTGDSVVIQINSLVTPVTFLSVNASIDVPASCEVLDTDNVSHTYQVSEGSYLGICALKGALDSGSISEVKLSNQYPSMGLFVTSIAGKEADPSSQYWALYKNGNYAETGLSSLGLTVGDVILFKLSDFSGNEVGDYVSITIKSLVANNTNGSGGGSGNTSTTEESFSITKALQFLSSKQNNDGSYSDDMYTDWVAIALSKNGGSYKDKIKKYLISNNIDSETLTDYERRAMALMSLGVNPYNGTEVNYIQKIIDSFDGTQIGDKTLLNDDIFAIIVLKNAGYDSSDEIIQKDISFLVGKGNKGSWGSVDLTSALIQALSGFEDIDGVSDALSSANDYILSNDKGVNSYGNPFTASWVLQSGVETINTKKYLDGLQEEDGGIIINNNDMDSRVWATAYAIPAIMGNNWDALMKNFNKISSTSSVSDNNTDDVEVEKSIQLLADTKNEDYILSTDKIDKPLIKNKEVHTNIKKDVLSTEESPLKDNIDPPKNNLDTKSTFWDSMGDLLLKIKGIFNRLFGWLGF